MTDLAWFLYSTGYLVVGVVVLFIAKKLFDLATPFKVDRQLTEKDNPAVGILMAGFLIGMTAVLCGLYDATGSTLVPGNHPAMGPVPRAFYRRVLVSSLPLCPSTGCTVQRNYPAYLAVFLYGMGRGSWRRLFSCFLRL